MVGQHLRHLRHRGAPGALDLTQIRRQNQLHPRDMVQFARDSCRLFVVRGCHQRYQLARQVGVEVENRVYLRKICEKILIGLLNKIT